MCGKASVSHLSWSDVYAFATAFSYAFLSKPRTAEDLVKYDALIDKALGLSLDGRYKEAHCR